MWFYQFFAQFVLHLVAEKVYNFHQEKPIFFNGSKLDIELDCHRLLDHHDNLSLHVSGLTPELDPEKLKFYLSALSDNVITDILLDDSCTKAVAKFYKPLGKLDNPHDNCCGHK